jgi:flagellar biosynthesis protein FlhG
MQLTGIQSLIMNNKKENPFTVAIGGGKGGVGKTFVAVSLGFCTAERGMKTILIDMDLGGGNLHTFLGMKPQELSLDEFFCGAEKSIDRFIKETPIPDLYYIPGIRKLYKSMSIQTGLREKFLKQVQFLPADVVIIDLGAGTHLFTLDIFSSVERGIVVVTPDAASVENALRFMKCAFYRKVERLWRKYKKFLPEEEVSITNFRYPADLIKYLLSCGEGGEKMAEEILETRWDVLVNFFRDENDLMAGEIIRKHSRTNLGIETKCLGFINFVEGLKPVFNGGEPLPKKLHPSVLWKAFHGFIQEIRSYNEKLAF